MTGASLAGALIERGLDPAELAGKEALFTAVVETFSMVRGGAPEQAFWIPGRLEVFGKHTDYAGGRTLVCALPRGFALVAAARPDRTVRVTDAWRGEKVTVDPLVPGAPRAGWGRYVDVAVRRLARNFPGCAFGAEIVLASDLPSSGGMSSSSALVIAIAACLCAIGDARRHPAWKRNLRSSLDIAAYFACIENGRRFASLDGDAGVGTHGGSEDHAAIIEGRPDMLSAFAFVPPRAVDVAPAPDAWRFVLATSAVSANKTGAAQTPYNRLAAGAGALLGLWNGASTNPPVVSLAAALASNGGAANRLRGLVRESSIAEWPVEALDRRLEHFIREDGRVPRAIEAFRRRDAETLGAISRESQADAEHLLGNQTPETVALAKRARERGAFAACSFGAGFGGSVWALAPAAEADAFAKAWDKSAFVARPGLPLTSLTPDRRG
jgi:galactokinase